MVSDSDTNKQHLFSVIMNCHNCAPFLREAIDSVFAQDLDDWEIVFYDNASSDDSASIAQGYGRRVKYFRNKEKLTLGAARNRAVEQASGIYLAFLDCDDVWLPGKLCLQKQALETPSTGREYAFCYTNATRIDQSGNHFMPYLQGKESAEGDAFLPLMRDCFIPMSSCVINRQVCLSLGCFDENHQMVEEWALWLRTAQRYDLAFVPESVTQIRLHSGNASNDYKLQSQETIKMIEHLQVDTDMQMEKQRVLTWYHVRYEFIHTLHQFQVGFFRGGGGADEPFCYLLI